MSQNGPMRRWFVGCEANIKATDSMGAIRVLNAMLTQRQRKIRFGVYDGKNRTYIDWGDGHAMDMDGATYNVTWLTTVVANSPFNAASTARVIQLHPSPGIAYRVEHLATGNVRHFVRKGNGNG